jgi:hypothetical protein
MPEIQLELDDLKDLRVANELISLKNNELLLLIAGRAKIIQEMAVKYELDPKRDYKVIDDKLVFEVAKE